jgi:hypothetical protein
MRFVGANPGAEATAEDALPGVTNYLIGRDPRRWRTNVRQYGRVRYRGLYPGVELVYYGSEGRLEYDLIAAAGADVAPIRLRFDSPVSAAIDAGGDLVVRVGTAEVRHRAPVVYQESGGRRRALKARYVRTAANEFGFDIESLDTGAEVRIDPTITYGTYLGGSGDDAATAIATDSAGSVYLAGNTTSLNLVFTPGAAQPANGGGQDAFVIKMDNAASRVLYATYVGGSGTDSARSLRWTAAERPTSRVNSARRIFRLRLEPINIPARPRVCTPRS